MVRTPIAPISGGFIESFLKYMLKKTTHKTTEATLLEEKNQILERLASLASPDKEKKSTSERPGWIDYGQKTDENAAEVAEYAEHISLATSLQKRLAELELALEAFSKGTYGVCEECGKSIDKARLKAFPAATTCLHCKKKG